MLEPIYIKLSVQPHSYTLTSKKSLGCRARIDRRCFYVTLPVLMIWRVELRGVNLPNLASQLTCRRRQIIGNVFLSYILLFQHFSDPASPIFDSYLIPKISMMGLILYPVHFETSAPPMLEKTTMQAHTDIEIVVFVWVARCIHASLPNQIFPLSSSTQSPKDCAESLNNPYGEGLCLAELFHHTRLFLDCDHFPVYYIRNPHSILKYLVLNKQPNGGPAPIQMRQQ